MSAMCFKIKSMLTLLDNQNNEQDPDKDHLYLA